MSAKRYEYSARVRRARRVRARVKAAGHLRLSVYRSARHIYAQVVNDAEAKTLIAASSLDVEFKKLTGGKGKKKSVTGGNKEMAEMVGKILGERAVAAGITEVSFDRGSYQYHGRVRSLAEGARAAGLKI